MSAQRLHGRVCLFGLGSERPGYGNERLLLVLYGLMSDILVQHRLQFADTSFGRVHLLSLLALTCLRLAEHGLESLDLTFLLA